MANKSRCGKNHSFEAIEKQNKTKELHGHKILDSKRTKFELYCINVRHITKLSYKEFSYIINPENIIFSNRAYGIDHILSKFDGFVNNISFWIISHPSNLRVITTSENSKKNKSSDISLEELLKRIKVFNENHKSSKFVKLFEENVELL